MKYKFLVLCIITAVVICALLTACGDNKPQSANTATNNTNHVNDPDNNGSVTDVPPLHAHEYVDGICTICGLDEGLQYITEDESVTITGYVGTKNTLIIPTYIDGHRVSTIGARAFYNNYTLRSITISEGITHIEEGAFLYSDNGLKDASTTVEIQLKLLYVEGSMQNNTTQADMIKLLQNRIMGRVRFVSAKEPVADDSLIYVLVPSKPENGWLRETTIFELYTSTNGMSFAFNGATGQCTLVTEPMSSPLQAVSIPNSLRNLEFYPFYGCDSLEYAEYDGAYYLGNQTNQFLILMGIADTAMTSLTIEENTKFIDANALNNAANLTAISIPNGIMRIDALAWDLRYFMPNMIFNNYENGLYLGNAENPYLIFVDAKNTDITNCTIHQDTKHIAGYAFNGCTKLAEVSIPESVTSIGFRAFNECTELFALRIPQSVSFIGDSAFADSGLASIEYDGTQSQWQSIIKSKGWETGLDSVVCTDQTIMLDKQVE